MISIFNTTAIALVVATAIGMPSGPDAPASLAVDVNAQDGATIVAGMTTLRGSLRAVRQLPPTPRDVTRQAPAVVIAG